MTKTFATATAMAALFAMPALAQTNPAKPAAPPAAQAPAKSGNAMNSGASSGASSSAASKSEAAKPDQSAETSKPEASNSAASMPEASKPAASTSATTGSATPEPGGKASFVTQQKPDQLLASDFKGTDVIGANGKKIGDVSDILFNSDGSIKAYVVSFGGFLGIGSKDVALAPQSFQVETGKNPGEIKLKLSMSEKDLKQAQAFKPYKPPQSHASAGGSLGGGVSHPPGPSR